MQKQTKAVRPYRRRRWKPKTLYLSKRELDRFNEIHQQCGGQKLTKEELERIRPALGRWASVVDEVAKRIEEDPDFWSAYCPH